MSQEAPLESSLESILGNPQMMAQIQKLAQSLGQPQQGPSPAPDSVEVGGNDSLEAIKAFSSLAQGAAIDKEQQALLNALTPYISRERHQKLEKAMRAAKMAQQASGLLGAGILGKGTGV